MKVFVTTEERFIREPGGRVWSGGSGSYSFWRRYLDVFESVEVVARIAEASTPPAAWKQADGPGVGFHALPYAVGPSGHARNIISIRQVIGTTLTGTDAVILRAFSALAPHIERQLLPGRPFGIELVGDPYEVFAPGCLNHPMRPLLRWYFTKQLKRQCRKACAVAYVTRHSLQDRYKSSDRAFSTVYSSIELPEHAFLKHPRSFSSPLSEARLVSVGSLERPYKGFDVLIEALRVLKESGLPLRIFLKIIGDGRCRTELEKHVKHLGMGDDVIFLGQIPSGQAVRDELDRADLFVLASRTEGLPRAMIEAMARGLPCLGTTVGGIPELLDREEMVPRNDVQALAASVKAMVTNPARLNRLSARNLARAREYQDSSLAKQRRKFLSVLRTQTERWSNALAAS